ncbi:MAG: type II toxin-antitoxin system VapC family toxin [Rhizobiaceae bacterium]|nr:type II toxin-antitoxin system VapC family toxin [Rhizobiaceae bacterium]
MLIDASALTAMMTDEQDAGELLARLKAANVRMTTPVAVWEAILAVARVIKLTPQDASDVVRRYLELMRIELMQVSPEATWLALDAFDRYGKGRHPASLNMGDCFAYACARHYRQPLLYKGADFARTDIEAA